MSQIIHIFCKDVRHHWIEILLCQAALVAYCWNVVRQWSNFFPDALSTVIPLVLPLTWCFFILRMVQDESLVGDRQFWVTRPYQWKNLLAAKILLILVFLNLPIFVAGAILLAKAGFSPAPHVLGLLWMQLLLFALPFVPLLALSAVTRSVTQGFLTLLTLFVLMIGITVIPLLFSRRIAHFSGLYGVSWSAPTGFNDVGDLLFVLPCLVAIGLQYSQRKTAQSRLWLVGGVLAAVTISLASAYAKGNQDPYPHPERSTIQFHVALDPVNLTPPKRPVEPDESVPVGLPLSASGVPANSLGWVRGIRVVLEAPDGYRWDGRWASNQLLVPGDNRWRAMFEMDYDDYQRLKPVPLKARVTVSADIFREHGFETITTTAGEFAVPGVGRCRMWRRGQGMLYCNSPLVRPGMVVVRLDPASSTCPAEDLRPPAVPPKPLEGLPYAWQPARDSRLPQGGVSPVATSFFPFWAFTDRVSICPGTPLDFTFPEFIENVRRDFEIDNFHLDDYRQADYSSEGIKSASGIRLGLPPLR
ncbi:MAG TPA: hypothetical protein VKL40_02865 [Candidatus Angelobacter sp.]|nr:hypothetical protein [Candidatus Angelobacter sp.]